MDEYIVFFASVTEEGDDGTFVDYPFLGGITDTKIKAEQLAKSITNDKSIPGAIIPKILPINTGTDQAIKIAQDYFRRLAVDMYDMEENRKK
jgi:hypothetical protein